MTHGSSRPLFSTCTSPMSYVGQYCSELIDTISDRRMHVRALPSGHTQHLVTL
jgi:hypothetical protein